MKVRIDERAYASNLKTEDAANGGTCIAKRGLHRRKAHFRDRGVDTSPTRIGWVINQEDEHGNRYAVWFGAKVLSNRQ
jgi:hypothetical protein